MAYDSDEFTDEISEKVINKLAEIQEDSALDKPNQDLLGTNENVKLINTLLSDGWLDNIAKKSIVKQFWAVNSQAVKLSNIESNDELIEFKNDFDVSKISFIMQQPAESFSFQDMLDLDQMEMNFDLSLRRSKGMPTGKINERGLIGMQIQQKISSHTEGIRNVSGYGGGWLNKVKGFFG